MNENHLASFFDDARIVLVVLVLDAIRDRTIKTAF